MQAFYHGNPKSLIHSLIYFLLPNLRRVRVFLLRIFQPKGGTREQAAQSRTPVFTCPVPATPRKRQPCRVASAARLPAAPDRRRRRYTCRGARSTAAASPLEIAPGRRGRAAHRSSAPFFTPQNRTCSSSPPPSRSLYTTAGHAFPPSSKSRLDSLSPPLAARFVSPAPRSPCSWISPIWNALLPRRPVAAGAAAAPFLPPQLPCMADLFPQIGDAAYMPLLPR